MLRGKTCQSCVRFNWRNDGSEIQLASSKGITVIAELANWTCTGFVTKSRHTGLLLLQGHLGPVNLHAVSEGHPEVGLLLRRHGLPSLLNVGEGRVGDGVSASDLLSGLLFS